MQCIKQKEEILWPCSPFLHFFYHKVEMQPQPKTTRNKLETGKDFNDKIGYVFSRMENTIMKLIDSKYPAIN